MIEWKDKLKPCIECEKMCEVKPVQLGDFFTLTYLRICSDECLFMTAYAYLYKIREHKLFRNHLLQLEDKEDLAVRKKFMEEVNEAVLKAQEDYFKENKESIKQLLSHPIPDLNMFAAPGIPVSPGTPVRFTRATIKDRLKWAREAVERSKQRLIDDENDLRKLEEEITKGENHDPN